MPKVIYHDKDARDKVLAGAETLYKAVSATMSPMGRNVAIKRPYGHTVTHDGVTVAESIVLPDVEEAIGAEIIREAAGKLNTQVGDGTTSVTVLTYHLLKGANDLVNSGVNPMEVKRGLERVLPKLLSELDSLVIELDDEKLMDVATISAGDKELGGVIGSLALQANVITVEQGNGLTTETELVEGYTLDRGYLSPHFITDKRKQEAILENPVVIITNEKFKSAAQIASILQPLVEKDVKSFLLVADEVTGEALSMLVQNHIRGNIQVAIIKSPAFGDGRLPALEDLAALTGGELLTDGSLEVGKAEKIIVGKEKTTIINAKGDTAERIAELKEQLKITDGEFEKEKLEKRIANLTGRVGIIRVGGASEAEIDEKKYRVDDAVAAVKAAQDGGIVAGGGVTFANLVPSLPASNINMVVRDALLAPLSVISENGGCYSRDLIERVLQYKGKGVNVMRPTGLVDMVEEGIIDPAKVTREVLQTAFSLAMTAITIDVLVVDIPDED